MPEPAADRVSILVVEDHEPNRNMLARRLRRYGFTVTEAPDAVSAIALARATAPQVILMDVGLPGLDGLTATRELKSDASTRPIRIMALTAHAMAQDRAAALEVGCDEFETKPINFDRLVTKIHGLLGSTAL